MLNESGIKNNETITCCVCYVKKLQKSTKHRYVTEEMKAYNQKKN